MKNLNRQAIFAGLGLLITFGQSYLLYHNLINTKPYKITDPGDIFHYTAYIGLPVSLVLCGIIIVILRDQVTLHLLPLIPVIAFPIIMWGIYRLLFALPGVDFFSGAGDFTPRQNELEFANDIVTVMWLGCLDGLLCAGVDRIITIPFSDGKRTK